MTTLNKSKKALVHVTGMQFSQDIVDGEDKIENVMPGSCQKIGDFYYKNRQFLLNFGFSFLN